MTARKTALGACLILAACVRAGTSPQSAAPTYKGILVPVNPEINRIQNPTSALGLVFDKLKDLEAGKPGQVAVFHIGDSHVEAGYFPGVVREGLQQRFGDAGRGYVKPVILGLYPKKRISSIVIRQEVKAIRLWAGLKPDDPSRGFNGLILYHDKGFEYYNFEILDENNQVLGTVKSGRPKDWPGMNSIQTSSVELPGTYRSVVLKTAADPQRTGPRFAQLYGLSLESGTSGVVYHNYGIIGGNCDTLLRSAFLHKQLERVQPDLIIISLGTNDASTPLFRREDFAARLDALLAKVREITPHSAILLTTAPDSYYPRLRRRPAKPNPNMAAVRDVIASTAAARGCAYWDLFTLMGGPDSMRLWRDSTLANADNIHFTKEGYQRQGRMLLDALMKEYADHGAARSR
ncbi:MAG: GDSL-type esterase/lipase family protein [Candidatus Aminicenantes bacterium]|nr:GDSL-type esterase/lipase family protein [Candidatus Aminicenantes bacterium]